MAKSVSRGEFLRRVSDRAGAHRRDVEHVWENALTVIQDAIKKGEAVSITGFGKFKQRVVKPRPAGTARNPFTGEMVKVSARPKSAKPVFTAAKQFKEFVGGAVKSLPRPVTRPMALAAEKVVKKATAARKPAKKKAGKKTAKKAAPKKKAASRKPAKKGAKRR